MHHFKRLSVLALCLVLLTALTGQEALAKAACSPKYRRSTRTVSAVDVKPTADAGVTSGGLAAEVVRQVNEERQKASLGALRVDAGLTRAACVRAREIVQKFSHTRPDGSDWSTAGAGIYGENIAMGQRTADKVMAAWLTSSGHRANILRPGFGSIGVCALTVNGVTYWAQLFGK